MSTKRSMKNLNLGALKTRYKPSQKMFSLHTSKFLTYSILRLMINIRQNVDISKFMKLQAFLKRLSVGLYPRNQKYWNVMI
ncbi:hypothetical protein PPYR_08811 [Photinus pyralis]|uniref:Uncharacterized protein n=1 Tax=Photinus pyralis TaxID=7054 RepID=A0A5N4AKS2_PHOPY|nr:hypothetical protein PPYR_08811 [Photinus pyralis]